MQKSRLIEAIAGLVENRKLPFVADVRDESAEDVRIVIEPKSRTVDPALMMESLFRTSELEARFSLNMNVLSHGKVPNVLSLRDVLRQWLEHRKDVLLRRSRFRLGKIADSHGRLARPAAARIPILPSERPRICSCTFSLNRLNVAGMRFGSGPT